MPFNQQLNIGRIASRIFSRRKYKDLLFQRETILKLSESFGACKRLNDYSLFIAKVNEGIDNKLPIKEAIENAIIYCNENDILSDILLKNRSEVLSMLLTEYDEKRHLKTVKQEGYDEGYQKGYEGGYNSRQTEVDELNSIIAELKKELGRKKD